MNLICDAHYFDDHPHGAPEGVMARMAGVLFSDWTRPSFTHTWIRHHTSVEPYETGAFYKREMPLILDMIQALPQPPTCVVIDGFVWLGGANGESQRAGMGARLWEALDRTIPVVGIAKNGFSGSTDEQKLWRGQSKKPLFVTAVGMSLSEAHQRVASMAGEYRLPSLVTYVDRRCRTG